MSLLPAAVYGLVAAVTCGRASMRPIMAVICDFTAGSVTVWPPDVVKTICSTSPDFCGATDCSSLMASDDGVLGRVNEFPHVAPTALPTTKKKIRTAAQAAKTMRRWRTHQPASVRIQATP